MPRTTITHTVDNYLVKLCSRDNGWDSSYRYRAVISLYQAGKVVAYLHFKNSVGNYSDSYVVYSDGTEVLKLLFEDRDFDRVLALLQRESPVYVNLRRTHQGNEGIGSITTSEEPIGEEES